MSFSRISLAVGQYCYIVAFQGVVDHRLDIIVVNRFCRHFWSEYPVELKLIALVFADQVIVTHTVPLRTSSYSLVRNFILC